MTKQTLSVLVHKATTGSKMVAKGLNLSEATSLAETIYDGYKILFRTGLAISGVAVFLVADENAEEILKHHRNQDKRILMQYGSY